MGDFSYFKATHSLLLIYAILHHLYHPVITESGDGTRSGLLRASEAIQLCQGPVTWQSKNQPFSRFILKTADFYTTLYTPTLVHLCWFPCRARAGRGLCALSNGGNTGSLTPTGGGDNMSLTEVNPYFLLFRRNSAAKVSISEQKFQIYLVFRVLISIFAHENVRERTKQRAPTCLHDWPSRAGRGQSQRPVPQQRSNSLHSACTVLVARSPKC